VSPAELVGDDAGQRRPAERRHRHAAQAQHVLAALVLEDVRHGVGHQADFVRRRQFAVGGHLLGQVVEPAQLLPRQLQLHPVLLALRRQHQVNRPEEVPQRDQQEHRRDEQHPQAEGDREHSQEQAQAQYPRTQEGQEGVVEAEEEVDERGTHGPVLTSASGR